MLLPNRFATQQFATKWFTATLNESLGVQGCGISLFGAFYCPAWGAGFLHTPPFVSPAELLEFTASIEFARLVAGDAGTTMAGTIVCWMLGVTLGVVAGVVTATLGVYRALPQAFLNSFGQYHQ
jgi:hypothetical protein